ncbi:MAG: hydroxylamine reductase [Actinomycetota bacterium]|nr:hydroxylamine reductase [Actinomycetota bacterium]
MFCNQCEQTAKGVACTVSGVCGKKPETAALQDLILDRMIALSLWAQAARKGGFVSDEVDTFASRAVFHTVTNVDFDNDMLASVVREFDTHIARVRAAAEAAGLGPANTDPSLDFVPAADLDALIAQAEAIGHFSKHSAIDDIASLMQVTIYGVKGICAYADHARVFGQYDPAVEGFVYDAFAALVDPTLGADEWVALALKAGEINLRTMELLDAAHTGEYGHPVPTEVPLGHRAGHAIVVTGHDLHDLKELLEQTQGTGIDVYTHGEMLPAHGYPELKKYTNFYGHYGTAWQNQRKEFTDFPGAILFTTNCIQAPVDSYTENVFTTGNVGWPGTTHVPNGEFGPVIERALALPGFAEETDGGAVMVGFGRNAVLGVAPTVIEAVKSGAIKHFFLVGGCDGAKPGRSYYSDFVEQAPADTVVLTLACGKFRFFDKQLGDIGGIPRLLDVGQCNDAYSAIKIAVALADAFEVGVNELPLSMILSWYEQKAVAILLTLLHLGITDIRLGPTLPAFITPNVLQVLVDNFSIRPIAETAAEDLAAILGDGQAA